MPRIKCTVTECQYNSDVMCDAPMVHVDHCRTAHARNSAQTQCETFKPRTT